MTVELGSGNYTFVVRDEWVKLPEEITLGDVAAVGVKHRDRVLAPVEGIDALLAVDADRGAVTQRDFLWHLRPILIDLEGVFATSELNCHASSPLCSALS